MSLRGLVFSVVSSVWAQQIVPSVEWERIYKDAACEFNSVVQSEDRGYLLGGRIYDIADVPVQNDCVLLKIDPRGETQWRKVYGGTGNEFLGDLVKSTDGGYIFAANSNSPPSPVEHVWIVKVDEEGDKQWERALVGSAVSILAVTEGGYLISGATRLTKIGEDGSTKWERLLEIDYGQGVYSARETSDGGCILAGITGLGSPDIGDLDGWLMKVDAAGNEKWERSFGGTEFDSFHSVDVTDGGGFIVAGRSSSPPSGNKESRRIGEMDYWVVKVDAEGYKEWDRSYDLPVNDERIRGTNGGGYVFSAGSRLIKIDSQGRPQWDQLLGRPDDSLEPYTVQIQDLERSVDGGYILCGAASPWGAGIPAFGCEIIPWAAKLERVVSRAGEVVTWRTGAGVGIESVDELDGEWKADEGQVLSVGAASALALPSSGQERYYRLRGTGVGAEGMEGVSLSVGALLSWPVNLNQKLEFASSKVGPWEEYIGDQGIIGDSHYAIVPGDLRGHFFRTRRN